MIKDIEPKLSSSLAKLRIYISNPNEAVTYRPGLLICPGGGYMMTSPREAEPIAFRFLSEGLNCFILDYSTYQKYPTPHLEVAAAMKYIRDHEKEFKLIKNSLSLIGFSAGGHLVGSFGYLYKEIAPKLGYNPNTIKPKALIMSYPVTLMNENSHRETREIITGKEKQLDMKLNIPTNVTKDYPPAFIWATQDDEMVPVINTLEMEKALKDNDVKHQCIVYESGRHGLSTANREVYIKEELTKNMLEVRDWASKASDFIFEILDHDN